MSQYLLNCHAQRDDCLKALAVDLKAKGHEAAFWSVDVADEAAMKAVIDAAKACKNV